MKSSTVLMGLSRRGGPFPHLHHGTYSIKRGGLAAGLKPGSFGIYSYPPATSVRLELREKRHPDVLAHIRLKPTGSGCGAILAKKLFGSFGGRQQSHYALLALDDPALPPAELDPQRKVQTRLKRQNLSRAVRIGALF